MAPNLKGLPSAVCPKRPVSFLQTGRPAKQGICALEFYEAAVADLTQPAKSGSSIPSRKAAVALLVYAAPRAV